MAGRERPRERSPAAGAGRLRAALRGADGGLRGGWLLAVSLACHVLAALAARRGLSAAFAALFDSWGIGAENALRAPAWARLVYVWHGSGITVAVGALTLALSAALRRLWLGAAAPRQERPRGLLPAAATGAGLAIAAAALFLALDSVRLEWPLSQPRLGPAIPALLAISLLSAAAEACFGLRVLYDGPRSRWGAGWATACACGWFFLSNAGYGGNALCAANVLLMGLLVCRLYVRRGLWAAVGFRWGWGFVSAFLLGFGGGEQSVYRLYHVSEAWLTGGDAGPVWGLWLTAALLAVLAWLERDRLRQAARRFAGRR